MALWRECGHGLVGAQLLLPVKWLNFVDALVSSLRCGNIAAIMEVDDTVPAAFNFKTFKEAPQVRLLLAHAHRS